MVATTAVLTLDTAIDESRKETAEGVGVARFPNRLCSRGGILCYIHRLDDDFLFSLFPFIIIFLPCFSLLFPSPPPAVFMPVSPSPWRCFVRETVIYPS